MEVGTGVEGGLRSKGWGEGFFEPHLIRMLPILNHFTGVNSVFTKRCVWEGSVSATVLCFSF